MRKLLAVLAFASSSWLTACGVPAPVAPSVGPEGFVSREHGFGLVPAQGGALAPAGFAIDHSIDALTGRGGLQEIVLRDPVSGLSCRDSIRPGGVQFTDGSGSVMWVKAVALHPDVADAEAEETAAAMGDLMRDGTSAPGWDEPTSQRGPATRVVSLKTGAMAGWAAVQARLELRQGSKRRLAEIVVARPPFRQTIECRRKKVPVSVAVVAGLVSDAQDFEHRLLAFGELVGRVTILGKRGLTLDNPQRSPNARRLTGLKPGNSGPKRESPRVRPKKSKAGMRRGR